MNYHVEYGGLYAESVIISFLQQRGFNAAKSFSECNFLWVPHTKVPWENVLDSGIIVSCYPVRTALVRKDALRVTLRERLVRAALRQGLSNSTLKRIRLACPNFIIINDEKTKVKTKTGLYNESTFDETDSIIVDRVLLKANVDFEETIFWVLKDVSTNNSLGIRFVSQKELRLLLESYVNLPNKLSDNKDENEPQTLPTLNEKNVIAEEYINNPVMLSGRKFHLRVNVLALGCLAVYVHKDVICHSACELFSLDPATFSIPSFSHITNNCIQRTHPHYERKIHTLLLSEAISRVNAERRMATPHNDTHTTVSDLSADSLFNEMCLLIRDTFAVLMQGRTTSWPLLKSTDGIDPSLPADGHLPPAAFIPNKSSFELFGWDFILAYNNHTKDGKEEDLGDIFSVVPVVLEVNGGPALEGTAWPMMCRRVLGDALETIETILLNRCNEESIDIKVDEKGNMNESDNSLSDDRQGKKLFPPDMIGDFIRVL